MIAHDSLKVHENENDLMKSATLQRIVFHKVFTLLLFILFHTRTSGKSKKGTVVHVRTRTLKMQYVAST